MATYKTIPFLRSSRGLNVVTDPVRIMFDPEKGIVDLATAYNVDIDSSGRISRRSGQTLKGNWNSRDSFCEGGECLFVSGSSLYRLNADYTRTGVRSGLTSEERMWYVQVGNKIYYANGIERGYVVGGISYIWQKGIYYGPVTSRVFSNPPEHITMLEVYKGRLYAVVDDVIWYSEPLNYGAFDLAANFIPAGSNVRFIKASYGATDKESDGLYVGTDKGVIFLEGDEPDKFSLEQVSDSPPVIGTAVRAESALTGDGKSGKEVIWTAQNGIWIGNANGSAICVTKDKLVFPSALNGAAVYHKGKYIVLLQE
jgi:hypothetical protein